MASPPTPENSGRGNGRDNDSLLGESGATVGFINLHLRRISEAVGGYLPAIAAWDAESLDGDAMLFDISNGSRRMAVAVGALQVFRGDLAVLEQVIDDGLGAFRADAAA